MGPIASRAKREAQIIKAASKVRHKQVSVVRVSDVLVAILKLGLDVDRDQFIARSRGDEATIEARGNGDLVPLPFLGIAVMFPDVARHEHQKDLRTLFRNLGNDDTLVDLGS